MKEIRTGTTILPILIRALRDLDSAYEYLNDTGDVESEELDQIATSIKHAMTKLDTYVRSIK